MPAAPGATPRKMLPPPMTMPISTPRRETCATSATMPSIVCRLIPKGSSPIRASPDSFRRMRLYFGVSGLSPPAPRVGDHVLRDLGAVEVGGLGERDVHGDVLADLVGACVVGQHADLGAVQVDRELAFGLQALEAPDAEVLAELLHQLLALLL